MKDKKRYSDIQSERDTDRSLCVCERGVVRIMGSTNLFQCKNEGQLLADPIDSQFYRGNLGVLPI